MKYKLWISENPKSLWHKSIESSKRRMGRYKKEDTINLQNFEIDLEIAIK